MDIRTDIAGSVLYIEDMDGLTMTGDISSPTRITLSTQSGNQILSITHYADFEGLIRLDLANTLKAYTSPRVPGDDWACTSEQTIQLIFSIVTPAGGAEEYSCELNCFSRDAQALMSDIDTLPVPMTDMLPIPLTLHSTSGSENVYIETAYSLTGLFTEICDNVGRSVATKTVYHGTRMDSQPFRILIEGEDGRHLRSPIYTPTPGEFELFLFRNRFGALELFPMSGDLHLSANHKFEVSRIGKRYNSSLISGENTFTQYSGPLTRKASKVLSSMLADGYAFHYVDGEWKRIVITSANVSLRKNDMIHRQSFSFRYQEDVDIRNMNI